MLHKLLTRGFGLDDNATNLHVVKSVRGTDVCEYISMKPNTICQEFSQRITDSTYFKNILIETK